MSLMRTKRLGRELAMVRQLDIVDSVDIRDQDIGTWQVNCFLLFIVNPSEYVAKYKTI